MLDDGLGLGRRLSYQRLEHLPYTLSLTVTSERATQGVVRVFLVPIDYRAQGIKVELDRWLVDLLPGENVITRTDREAAHLARSQFSLRELQNVFISGRLSREELVEAGCGGLSTWRCPGVEGSSCW